jgi:hypothetical protein
MAYYPFSERKNLLVFTCTHILDGEKNINLVTHHFDDNSWEFLCGEAHKDEDAVIISIDEICNIDKSIEKLCDLPVGYCATRKNITSKWIKSRIPGEKAYPKSL